jgi:hypothetical protein
MQISGIIEMLKKDKFAKGTSLKVTFMILTEMKVLLIQTLRKICANFLNRLLNVDQSNRVITDATLFPQNGILTEKKLKVIMQVFLLRIQE